MAALQFTEIAVCGSLIHTFKMQDRRAEASSTSRPTRWCFQMQIEALLYGNTASTGSFYRLLQRTPGAKGRALCLRHRSTSISNGWCSQEEWGAMVDACHSGVRSFTLVPIDVVGAAIEVHGETKESVALLDALGFDRPKVWDEDDACEGHAASERGDGEMRAKKAPRIKSYTLSEVPAQLERELAAFCAWRLKPVNRERDGGSVEPVTAEGNKADILRFLGWLNSEKSVTPSMGGVFGSDRLGAAVQQFIDHLVSCERSYSTIAGYVKSFIAAASFVHAVRVSRAEAGAAVSTAPVEAMRRAHRQAMQQARVQQKFSGKPKAWLSWAQVQTARAKAVREYKHAAEEGDEEGDGLLRRRLFDATLLTWLTSVPPDRVGVTRQLRLGVTLKTTGDGSFDLDLSTPDAHKTAAVFGPTRTAVPAATAKLLASWLQLAGLHPAQQPFIFVLSTSAGHAAPIDAKQWTKVVQAAMKRHTGVAFAPKDLRSSYVTFLRSEDNSDAVLKAAAQAMRHSTTMSASAAYDKERSSRLSQATVQQAQQYAAQF